MPRPTVLIVAYAFPPHSVVGAQRPLRMVKYLPDLAGWRPVVLSVARRFSRTDPGLLDEIPADVPVERVPSWEPLLWLERRRAGAPPAASATSTPAPSAPSEPASHPGGPWRSAKQLLRDLLSTPDPQLGWVPSAVMAGLRLARRHRPDVILATAPPWSALVAGHLLSKLTRIPWVADYRDPWTDIDRGPVAGWRQRAERRLEDRVLSNAAAALTSSDHYTGIMRGRFPGRPAADFATMFNGFDEAKFDPTPTPEPDDGFTITHLGSLYSYVHPEPVFTGLRDWLAAEPDRRRRVRLQFIGKIDGTIRGALDRLGLIDLVVEPGFVPHAEAIARCRRSSVLLLAMGIGPKTPAGWMPSKLYEYLACRTPILAYTVRGEAAAAIERADAGVVVSSDDSQVVVAALDDLSARGGVSGVADDGWPPAVRRFKQAEIIPGLASILERVRRR